MRGTVGHLGAIRVLVAALALLLDSPLRADDSLLPPITQSDIGRLIVEARLEASRAAEAEARACERDYERAKNGRVARPAQREALSDGVDMTAQPPLFESMQRKGQYLRELQTKARMEGKRAEWLASRECDWLPELDLHMDPREDKLPMIGAIGRFTPGAEIPPAGGWGPAHERLGLRVLSSNPEGSAIVVAEVKKNFIEYDMNFPRTPGTEPPSWIESKVLPMGVFALRGWPALAGYQTDARLPQPIPGVWRVAGTTTHRTQIGALRTILVLELECTEAEAQESARDYATNNITPQPKPSTQPTTPAPSP